MIKKYIKETIKYLLRCYPITYPYIKEIEKMYVMTPDELKKRNEQVFLKIFRKAYDKSPFYNKLYTEANISKEDINSLDDIKKLPIITKEMVKQHANEILVTPKWKLIKNHTSGTTGTPMTVYEDWPSIWREQAYFYCYRKRCGFMYGQPLVSLRGNLDKKDLYLKIHVSNTLYLSSYNINQKSVEIYYKKIREHNPIAIEGYPSSLYNLAILLKENNLQLHIPLTFTSSESLLEHQRSLIEKQFNSQIYDHFGTTERTIRLSETLDHSGYFEDPGYSINEYLNDGEITTSLINESFPLIRYKGDDIIERMQPNIEKDKISIKKILGRKSTCLIGKDGTHYSGALLTRVFKDIISIDYAQFIQNTQGKVTLNIVTNNNFSQNDKIKLDKIVHEQLGKNNFDIIINQIDKSQLIITQRGKFNYIINNISK